MTTTACTIYRKYNNEMRIIESKERTEERVLVQAIVVLVRQIVILYELLLKVKHLWCGIGSKRKKKPRAYTSAVN